MKKYIKLFSLFLIIIFFFSITVLINAVDFPIEIDETNFPDENFRKYIKDEYDENEDSFLSQEECVDATVMNVTDKEISNFAGIEYLTALNELNCSNNQLTSLDLSENTALTTLNCSNNQLTSLDISKNVALTALNCSDNQLTSLDISKNVALTTLNCSDNQLTSLDIQGTQLKHTGSFSSYTTCSNNNYTINKKQDFDLNTLPGNFDVTKVLSVNGGTFNKENKTFSFEGDSNTATYEYDCGESNWLLTLLSFKATFKFTYHEHSIEKVEAKAATCTQNGNIEYYKCTACGKLFSDEAHTREITLEDTIINALNHDWGIIEYAWLIDSTGCTAKRTCTRDPLHTETANSTAITSIQTKNPTCTEKGETTYIATFSEEWAGNTTRTIPNIPALEHDWDEPGYTWADNMTNCTATHICKRDPLHTETVNSTAITSIQTKAPTCNKNGETTYTATFAETWADHITKVLDDIPMCNDAWGDIQYTWSEDMTSCIATRICTINTSTVETATTTNIISNLTKEATCTEKGETTYTAIFTEEWANNTIKTLANIDIIPHTIIKIKYKAPTCTQDGNIEYYKCTVCGKIFKDSNCNEEITLEKTIIPAIGHNWGILRYTWSDDMASCTATRICINDRSHVEKVTTKNITKKEIKQPTCTENGETTYIATFSEEWAGSITRTIPNIPALEHDWDNIEYTWSDDMTSCTATRVCKKDNSHVETVSTANIISEKTKEPTYNEKGETTYTAIFEESWAGSINKVLDDIPTLVNNAQTTDTIINYVILLIVSGIGIIAGIIYMLHNRKKQTKKKRKIS